MCGKTNDDGRDTEDPIKNDSIVATFPGMKPTGPDDVSCPSFTELKYANGCKFDCQWCFLLGTLRFDKEIGKSPRVKDKAFIARRLEKVLKSAKAPLVFNAGELSDGLIDENVLLEVVIPLFLKYKDRGHKLLLLTKSNSMKLLSHDRGAFKDVIIMAYSINAIPIADRYERIAPDPMKRLYAAREFSSRGYEVRIRLDPMVPMGDWKTHYRNIIEKIVEYIPHASVITLGTLRAMQTLLTQARIQNKDISWKDYLTEEASRDKAKDMRLPTETRIEMYGFAIGQFRRLGFHGRIGLCKETRRVFEAIQMNPFQQCCNCISDSPLTPLGVKETSEEWGRLVGKIVCTGGDVDEETKPKEDSAGDRKEESPIQGPEARLREVWDPDKAPKDKPGRGKKPK